MHVLHKIVVEAENAAEATWKAREAIEAHQPEICDYYDEADGIVWSDDVDLAAEEVWLNGTPA